MQSTLHQKENMPAPRESQTGDRHAPMLGSWRNDFPFLLLVLLKQNLGISSAQNSQEYYSCRDTRDLAAVTLAVCVAYNRITLAQWHILTVTM